MSAGQALSVKLFLGKGLSAWFAKTYLAFKVTQNSLDFLFSYKDFRDVLDKIGDNNEVKDFRLAFGELQNKMELGGFSVFDAILLKQKYAVIVQNLHELERYWQIVKLHPDVNKILDEKQKEDITKSIMKALETYEKNDIVE